MEAEAAGEAGAGTDAGADAEGLGVLGRWAAPEAQPARAEATSTVRTSMRMHVRRAAERGLCKGYVKRRPSSPPTAAQRSGSTRGTLSP